MLRQTNNNDRVRAWHAAQIAVIGSKKQFALSASRVVVVGCGRIGASFSLAAHGAGIGHLVCIDPQRMEAEQLGPWTFAHQSDLRRFKVSALARALSIRHTGSIEAIPQRVEATDFKTIVKAASLAVCCANSSATRIFVERHAIAAGVPVMQVAAFDSREQLGGTVNLWTPMNRHLACYGCLETAGARRLQDSALLTSVTASIANFAAHLALSLLVDHCAKQVASHNLFLFNLEECSLESLAVLRRKACRVCGKLCP